MVPAKLVRRILLAEDVDMAELLCDNMEAERRRVMVEGSTHQGHFANRPEVPDVLSWFNVSYCTLRWWRPSTQER